MDQWENDKVSELEQQIKQIPEGQTSAHDTAIATLIQEKMKDPAGLMRGILNIWKQSSDKKAVTGLFYEFTGISFDMYLESDQTNQAFL